ncbi:MULTISPECIES: DUF6176 family protein [Halorussus]|uniref:DUF6176 family protein n=1 Tax=Halorussus TaxID=1070314 RepID=UPI0020A00DB6|nr:DUF6176 family protein [Halorussus vallis]USZ73938.1 DUF6176 family protein [Halorussus vallis]
MTDVVLTKQKVEPGKEERLREWMAEVRSREDEALETLAQEGMHTESAFLEHTDDGTYLVYFMEADDMDAVYDAYQNSDHDIDHEHQSVMAETLADFENVGDYEPLYHLVNHERPGTPTE